MNNYIIIPVEYKKLANDKFLIDGKVYLADLKLDPEYMHEEYEDGTLHISYWALTPEVDVISSPTYLYAFNAVENPPEEIYEWSDAYDDNSGHVLQRL